MMFYRVVARAVAAVHVTYVIFVVTGSLLVFRWPSLLWVHVAAIVWAVLTMTTDLGCALTTWEKSLWRRGGLEPYPEGFLQHHVLRTAYTGEKSRQVHLAMGAIVIVLNATMYALIGTR